VGEVDLSQYKEQMERAIEHLRLEMSNLRTGRATPGAQPRQAPQARPWWRDPHARPLPR
jgi:hypothetical protein